MVHKGADWGHIISGCRRNRSLQPCPTRNAFEGAHEKPGPFDETMELVHELHGTCTSLGRFGLVASFPPVWQLVLHRPFGWYFQRWRGEKVSVLFPWRPIRISAPQRLHR
jgi:hypothetical protein